MPRGRGRVSRQTLGGLALFVGDSLVETSSVTKNHDLRMHLLLLQLLWCIAFAAEWQYAFDNEEEFLENNRRWRTVYRNYSHDAAKRAEFRRESNHPACQQQQQQAWRDDQNRKTLSSADAVLFRMHTTTTARWSRFTKALSDFRTAKYDVHVSVDTTYYEASSAHVVSLLQPLLHKRLIARLHLYNDSQILAAYPGLLALQQHLPKWLFQEAQPSCSRFFHLEALMLWWRDARRSPSAPSRVWVVEDDVGVAGGSLLDFVSLFEAQKADLVTYGAFFTIYNEKEREDWRRRWVFSDVVSPAFARVVHERDQQYTHEHVQRFSSRALESYRALLRRRFHAQSELGSITLLARLCPELSVLQMPRDAIGGLGDNYTVDGLVDPEAWKKELQQTSAGKEKAPRLFHALKW